MARTPPAPRRAAHARRPARRRTRRGGARPASLELGISPARRPLAASASSCSSLGAVTLIALLLPGRAAHRLVRDVDLPFFGAGRWLLPFLLLVAGWFIERGPGKELGSAWGRTLGGIALAFIGAAGLFELAGLRPADRRSDGGSGRTAARRRA